MTDADRSVDSNDSEALYERTDIRASTAVWLGVGIAALTLAALVSMFALLRILESRPETASLEVSPGAGAVRTEAPLPAIAEQMEALRATEKETLGTYAWVDREKGTVRVPIERAMELIVEHDRRRRAMEGEK